MTEGLRSRSFPEKLERDAVLLSPEIVEERGDGVSNGGESEEKGSPTLSNVKCEEVPLVSVARSEEIEEKRDGLEHVECGEGGDTVKRKRGRKRKNVDGDKCDGGGDEPADKGSQILSHVMSGEVSLVTAVRSEEIGEKRDGFEHVECGADGNTGRRKRGRKRKNVTGDKCDGAGDRSEDKASLLLNHGKYEEVSLVNAARSEETREKKDGLEHVECGAGSDTGKRKRGRKRKNIDVDKCDGGGNESEDKGSLLLSNVKHGEVSSISAARSEEIQEKRDGLEHVECGEGGNTGKRKRGRKRKKVDGDKCHGGGDGLEDKGSLLLSHVKCGEVPSINAARTEDIEVMRDGLEHIGCGEGSNTEKRKRGRRRKNVDGNKCQGVDAMKKLEEPSNGDVGFVGRVLRSRSAARTEIENEKGGGKNEVDMKQSGSVVFGKRSRVTDGGDKVMVQMEKSESNQLIGILKKRGRGRPKNSCRLHGTNGVVNVTRNNKGVFGTGKDKRGSQLAAGFKGNAPKNQEKKFVAKLSLNCRSSSKKRRSGDDGRSTKKQLLRLRIIDMLLSAGWKVDYRPRRSKEYKDAVYVSPEGRGYWSVTLAYSVLKKSYEGGIGDCKTSMVGFSFTPIPEEELSILSRITKKQKEKENKLKQKGDGGDNADEGCIGKKSAKKKHGAKNELNFKYKEKLSSKMVKRHKFLKETQNRKRCALLVRSSQNSVTSELDGYAPYFGKRSVLTWMIDLGVVPLNAKVQYMNQRRTQVMLEGTITRDGIYCRCCNEIVTISKFETHAGSRLCQASQNIYLETGISLLQCQLDSWNKQDESDRNGFVLINVDGDDPNDDTCGICGDGGDLICCDGCPSTFHQSCLDIQKLPLGEWHCVYCSCKFCGRNSCQGNGSHDKAISAILTCRLCEEKYHQSCVQANDAQCDDSNSIFFCQKRCQELFARLQMLIGVRHELEEGFSWTFIQRSDVSSDVSLSGACQNVESNSKLAVASSIMDECFLPIVDQRSGISLMHNIVYNFGSNFNRLNYTGFITAILERGDEIISAASIRIHGNQLAEMPFIATRNMYRRQGMCRRLLVAIESALCTLNVEKLVIPAIHELMQTWTSVFGFKHLNVSDKQVMRRMNLLVFPGTDMLQKPLLKHQFSEENMIPTAAVMSSELSQAHKNVHEGVNNSDGPDSIIFGADIVHCIDGTNREPSATDTGLQLPGGSLHDTSGITTETINFAESSADANCLIQPSITGDEGKNDTVMSSIGSANDVHEFISQCTTEGINDCKNDASIAANCDKKVHASMAAVESVSCEVKVDGSIGKDDVVSHEDDSVQQPADISTQTRDAVACHDSESTSQTCLDVKDNYPLCGSSSNCSFNSLNKRSLHDSSELLRVKGCTLDADDNMVDTCGVKNEVASKEYRSVALHERCLASSGADSMIISMPCNFSCDVAAFPTFQSVHQRARDVENGSSPDFPVCSNISSSSLGCMPDGHEVAVGRESHPLCTASSNFTAEPNNQTCGGRRPVELSHQTANAVTVNDVCDTKDAVTDAHTDSHSHEEPSRDRPQIVTNSLEQSESTTQCNSDTLCKLQSSSGMALICASGGCNSCGIP
ncbi:uncharacterized protein LOC131155706 [Malania oleifera]|uniref:uncharacterized protein LOC131155706 n=1 Tax=Malania oleifera TaxID=397392 RepID=UPI0025AE9D78|nr:uncharacterized protein LOC131155706 [Malania oleifera]